MRIPFPADVTLDDLEKAHEVLEKLEYLFIATNPAHAIETERVIAHLRITIRRVINMYDKIRLTREVNM
jgi:hypothetical protein